MAKYFYNNNNYSIAVRKIKSGNVYDVRFRIIDELGQETQKRLSGFKSKNAAKEAYLDFISKCEFLPNYRKLEIKRKCIDVASAFKEYIKHISSIHQNKESTIYDKLKVFDLFILPEFSNKLLPISKVDLKKWQSNLLNKNFSWKYTNKIRGYFSSFLSWCEIEYEFPNNFRFIEHPKKRASDHIIKFWDKETFEQFIAVVDDLKWKTLFTLLFYTGRRKGELFALNINDVDLKNKTIVWNKSLTKKFVKEEASNVSYKITSTKRDKVQILPICERAYNIINEYIAAGNGEGKFFFGNTTPLAENTVTRYFQRYCAKAELEPIRIHDLRHSFASMLLHNGVNYQTIATLIGDTTEQVIATYCHIANSDIDNAICGI